MKRLYIIPEVQMLFIYDQRDGGYEAIQLSDDDCRCLRFGLDKALRLRAEPPAYLRVIDPYASTPATPQKS